MTLTIALVLLAAAIAFGSLILAAAIRPYLLMVFWKILRGVCLLGWAYFGASMVASSLAVLLGHQNLWDWSSGRDYWPFAQFALCIAIGCGLISLVGRFVAGKDAVPWFFDSEVDVGLFGLASIGLIWFSVLLTQIGIDFLGVSAAGFGGQTVTRVVVYGLPIFPIVTMLLSLLYALRAQRKAQERYEEV